MIKLKHLIKESIRSGDGWFVHEGTTKISCIFEDGNKISFDLTFRNKMSEEKNKWRTKATNKWLSVAKRIHSDTEITEIGNIKQKSWFECFQEALNNEEMKPFIKETNKVPIFDPVNFTPRTEEISKKVEEDISSNIPPLPSSSMIQSISNIINDKNFLDFIKTLENSQKMGFIKNRWYPHASPEGGLPTIGYGHKISSTNELEKFKNGVTDDIINNLLKKDLERAYNNVIHYIDKEKNKLGLKNLLLSKEQLEMLIEFAFNLGSLDKFPKFTTAVLNKDWDVVKREYKRFYRTNSGERKELLTRNYMFYDRFLKNV